MSDEPNIKIESRQPYTKRTRQRRNGAFWSEVVRQARALAMDQQIRVTYTATTTRRNLIELMEEGEAANYLVHPADKTVEGKAQAVIARNPKHEQLKLVDTAGPQGLPSARQASEQPAIDPGDDAIPNAPDDDGGDGEGDYDF